jgi:pyruvate dehydrogenase E2 component (dihydrolipoamide acetyltransferase)
MATKIFMEALSPTMEEGRLVKWNKNEGDAVKQGDVLAEVETDKAVMELVARGEGVLRARLVAEGAAVPVGTLVGVIGAKDEDISALVAGAGAAAAGAVPPSAPAAASAPASNAGASRSAAIPASVTPVVAGASATHGSTQSVASGSAGRTIASPLARKLAGDRGVELSGIAGSGPGGRIVKRDIEAIAAAGSSARAAAPVRRAIEGDFEDVPLTMIRKTIAKRLAESIGPIPTFYLTAELDLARAAEMRAAAAELGDEYKVSFNDIILKATATALA